MNKSLYEISGELEALNDALMENGGELTPEIETGLAIAQADLNVKGANYGIVYLNNNATINAIDAEIERLTKKRAVIAGTNDRLKKAVSDAMQHFGIEKIETAIIKLSFRASETLEISDESIVPEKFKKSKTTVTIDKTVIKKAIKAGEDVPGAFIEKQQNIQIK